MRFAVNGWWGGGDAVGTPFAVHKPNKLRMLGSNGEKRFEEMAMACPAVHIAVHGGLQGSVEDHSDFLASLPLLQALAPTAMADRAVDPLSQHAMLAEFAPQGSKESPAHGYIGRQQTSHGISGADHVSHNVLTTRSGTLRERWNTSSTLGCQSGAGHSAALSCVSAECRGQPQLFVSPHPLCAL
jgi:hypothetical protein